MWITINVVDYFPFSWWTNCLHTKSDHVSFLLNEVPKKMRIRHLRSLKKSLTFSDFLWPFWAPLHSPTVTSVIYQWKRVLEMAQSAVCRWAVIHGCNSCSPHTALWLCFTPAAASIFFSPNHLHREFSTSILSMKWQLIMGRFVCKHSRPEPLKGKNASGQLGVPAGMMISWSAAASPPEVSAHWSSKPELCIFVLITIK